MSEQVTVREFARRLGVSHPAVIKARKAGRLRQSIGTDAKGRPVIVDFDLAVREWQANAGRLTKPQAVTVPAAVTAGDQVTTTAEGIITAPTLADAQRVAVLERARLLRLSLDVKTGKLVDKEAVVRQQFEIARIIREGMLNLPARLSAELAAETDPSKVYAKLDTAIRQALGAVAAAMRTAAHG